MKEVLNKPELDNKIYFSFHHKYFLFLISNLSCCFFPPHVHVTMESPSYISIAGKLNQCHLFTYPPVCESILELIYILKCLIIILLFMIIGLFVIKTVLSINNKIS